MHTTINIHENSRQTSLTMIAILTQYHNYNSVYIGKIICMYINFNVIELNSNVI